MVDGDDEFRRADGFDFLNQSFELGNVFKVAAEQNNATDGRVEQALFFFFGQMIGSASAMTGPREDEAYSLFCPE